MSQRHPRASMLSRKVLMKPEPSVLSLPSHDEGEQRRIPVRIRFCQLSRMVASDCGLSSAGLRGSLLVFMWQVQVAWPHLADEG